MAAFAAVRVVAAFSSKRRIPIMHTTQSRHAFLSLKMSSSSSSSSTTSTTSTTTASSSTSTDDEDNVLVQDGRLSRGNLSSLDVRVVTDHLDIVLSHLKSRRASTEAMEAAKEIASTKQERSRLIQERDAALSVRKEQSAIVGMLMRKKNNDNNDDEDLQQAKTLSSRATQEAQEKEEQLALLEEKVATLLAGLPNLLDDSVVDGDDETQNQIVKEWGDPQALPKQLEWMTDNDDGDDYCFKPKWHDDVASGLMGYKAEEAVRMSGSRFVALSGVVAQLERALGAFFLDMHTTKHGYTEVSVPLVVGRTALEGTSQLPKFEEDLFRIAADSHTCNGQDAFLIPTAEVPLTNMHRESILQAATDLPISYVALTPCFRAEAGSYGRDTRGLIRTHQFSKVELVKITTAETSEKEHEALTSHAEACLEALKLPYRKVRLCSGDIGFSARMCYDLEVWLPGQEEYREISSCSNTGDFQARRMGLRYRPEPEPETDAPNNKKKKNKKPKPQLCHTINGSGLAVGRALVAVLENYQMPDGSLKVPDVLIPYMGGKEVLKI
eukprot:CAMPEP_0118714122 /NCGR_PEP_ID=MMETSP0800-20121206/25973_1 /TAXON_ID=210618 ORGANISM="Striatella unipunctata, Strain CCMP2910" /NCGR_SAMPLE_ID=MMETSP0800 /ASSEMBLY_ACC=CAM_ASM_000638 /LENGTH=553 /DNA_ID=CAMNT_0006619803 /DNA_START=153 /DNA_END=1814 /DNA_ORIENTATION=-